MVVPGSLPMGCCALYLNKFQVENQESYDPRTGCINWLNDFAIRHDRLLVEELQRRQRRHLEVTIMYADVYHATTGFKEPVLAACCGYDGGAYRLNATVPCGSEGSSVCSDPSKKIWWDGEHTTEAEGGY
ncbi:sinapine esterase-like [Zingiber officinale]|uniref:sinapine esterase-like n=1 Tax=Zingiber officinale TaxID=94328 RepID=UPI001C4B8541|nr:sinapine esterase-like [Zingiber officinale]